MTTSIENVNNKNISIIDFNPMRLDNTGHRWNPLEEIRIFTQQDVSDAQNIFLFFSLGLPWHNEYKMAERASINFITALALHMRYVNASNINNTYESASLSGMANFLINPAWDSDKQIYATMFDAIHDPEGKMNWKDSFGKPTKTHPMIARAAKAMLNIENFERSNILLEANTALALYLDPIIAKNMAKSDFLIRELMESRAAIKVNYSVDSANEKRLTQLTNLFYLYSNSLQGSSFDVQIIFGNAE